MVEEKKEKELPKTLVKYYECNEFSVDALNNNYLWATYPLDFNDPFDCPIQAWDEKSFATFNLKKIIDPEFYQDFGKEFKTDPKKNFFKFLKSFFGIICLNEYKAEYEDLFWGYYTNQTGFSLEFNRSKLSEYFNMEPEEINYKHPSDFEIFRITENVQFADELFPIFTKWILQKKRIWENETEWRYIFFDINAINENSRKKGYSKESIVKITLGFKFFEVNLLEPYENEFRYNCTESNNPNKIKLIKILLENPDYKIFWIHMHGYKLQLQTRPILLRADDLLNIRIKFLDI